MTLVLIVFITIIGLIGLVMSLYGLCNILSHAKSKHRNPGHIHNSIVQIIVGYSIMGLVFGVFVCLESTSLPVATQSAHPLNKSVSTNVTPKKSKSISTKVKSANSGNIKIKPPIYHKQVKGTYYNTPHGIYKYTGLNDSGGANYVRQPTLQAVMKEEEHVDNAYNNLQPQLNKYSTELPPTDNENDD